LNVETEIIDAAHIMEDLLNSFCKACNICKGHYHISTALEKAFISMKEATCMNLPDRWGKEESSK
jgi:hypothetical protein